MDHLQETCGNPEEEEILIKWLQLLINLIGTNRKLNDAIDCYCLFVYRESPVLKHYRCDVNEIVSYHCMFYTFILTHNYS